MKGSELEWANQNHFTGNTIHVEHVLWQVYLEMLDIHPVKVIYIPTDHILIVEGVLRNVGYIFYEGCTWIHVL